MILQALSTNASKYKYMWHNKYKYQLSLSTKFNGNCLFSPFDRCGARNLDSWKCFWLITTSRSVNQHQFEASATFSSIFLVFTNDARRKWSVISGFLWFRNESLILAFSMRLLLGNVSFLPIRFRLQTGADPFALSSIEDLGSDVAQWNMASDLSRQDETLSPPLKRRKSRKDASDSES